MAKRLMTPDDLYNLQSVGDAQISPDGRLVAHVREQLNKADDKARTEIWLAPAAGGKGRKLTAGPADRQPRWSPDGSRIAFVSSRSGKPQLWLIAADGGEAVQIETEQEVASAPAWSPDGTQIAFLAVVEEQAEADTPAPAYPGAPVRGADDVKVVTTFHHKQDGVGFFLKREPRLFVVAAEAGKQTAKQVSPAGMRCEPASWAPDGRRLIASVASDLDQPQAIWTRNLYLFDVATGEAQLVLREQEYPSYAAAFSPDGRYLAFSGEAGSFAWMHNNFDLFLLDVSAGAYPYSWGDARNLSEPLDRPTGGAISETMPWSGFNPFGHIVWAPDSSACLSLMSDRGNGVLYSFPVSGDNPLRLMGDCARAAATFSLSWNGRIAYSASDSVTPDEIFLLDREGERKLTDFNGPFLAEVEIQRVERFTYPGADGWEMEAWLVYPAGYEPGKRYPTVLEIHGGPTGFFGNGFMTSHQVLAAAGFAVLATNPRGSQSYGKKHAWGCVDDWGGKDYIDIQNGVDEAIRRGVADPDRLGVTGWSYGGFMTCWTVTQTNRFKAAVAGAPVSNLDDMYTTSDIGANFMEFEFGANPWEGLEKLAAHSPIRFMHRCTTPMLLLHGESDLRCPVHQSEQVYGVLKRLGRTAVMVRYPGEPHGLGRPSHRVDKLERVAAWFGHYL